MRWNNITLSYSYFFITILIAFVALAMMFISGIKDNIDVRKTRKMGLACTIVQKYSYRGFTFNNTTQFIANLTLVFAFFSFLSTCIVIAY